MVSVSSIRVHCAAYIARDLRDKGASQVHRVDLLESAWLKMDHRDRLNRCKMVSTGRPEMACLLKAVFIFLELGK